MANRRTGLGLSRREFLGTAGMVAAAGAAAPLAAAVETPMFRAKAPSPNDTLVIGLIGCAGMGMANVRTLMGFPDVAVAAVCDVDENRIPNDRKEIEKKYGKAPDVYNDYRKLLERKDIDAVVIGTPDHWHALNFIHACEAGKDSYCEKPISHNIVEASAMAAACLKHKRVVQVGTWQRSTNEFVNAIDYVRSGKLGKVVLCRAWISDGHQSGRKQPIPVPSGFDYDFWVGPAKFIPFQDNRTHYNWRWQMNFGGGLSTDWGVHMMDIALLGMSKDQDIVMPTSCTSLGGQWAFENDDRTAPDTMEAIYQFADPDFVMHWAINRDHPGKPGHCTEFVSSDGRTLRVWRGGWLLLDPDGKELPKEEPIKPPNHWRDWVDCVKTRSKPRADLVSVAKTTIVCHMSNASLMSGETVRWNDKAWDLEGKAGKQTTAYRREYRKPWSLPKYKMPA